MNGSKRFEFRKAIFRDGQTTKVYVYASAPISRVIGEFEISEVIESSPSGLWKKTKAAAGITEEFFRQYFRNRKIAYAIGVVSPIRYRKPRRLDEMFGISHPPQSFRYVPA